ncbi:hypothetical protein OHC98_07385 [Escherichia coli]|nr:hypothetical protein [Escherichia coli]
MTIYITELITGLLVIAGLFIWGEREVMNLDEQDAQTISSYIRASRPDYKGPVFVDLSRLEEIYMWKARLLTHFVIRTMTSNITKPM